jgi:hypothetical protein
MFTRNLCHEGCRYLESMNILPNEEDVLNILFETELLMPTRYVAFLSLHFLPCLNLLVDDFPL